MVKEIIFPLLLTFLSIGNINAQSPCSKPYTIFSFKNGKEIKLCGSSSIDNYYSEFILALGDSNIFEADGTQSFKINFQGDSLILEEYKWLPVGENRTFVSALWLTVVFKYESQLTTYSKINRKLRRYNDKEVISCMEQFLEANDSTPNKEELAAKLFIASLSQKIMTERYFYAIQTKFHSSLDGAFSEDYADLISMYNYWNDSKAECEYKSHNNELTSTSWICWGIGGGKARTNASDRIYTTTIVNESKKNVYYYFEKSTHRGCLASIDFSYFKKYNEEGQLEFIFQNLDSKYTKTTFDTSGKIIKTETIDSSQFEMEKRRDY
jgi:hypothetical protein